MLAHCQWVNPTKIKHVSKSRWLKPFTWIPWLKVPSVPWVLASFALQGCGVACFILHSQMERKPLTCQKGGRLRKPGWTGHLHEEKCQIKDAIDIDLMFYFFGGASVWLAPYWIWSGFPPWTWCWQHNRQWRQGCDGTFGVFSWLLVGAFGCCDFGMLGGQLSVPAVRTKIP